MRAIFGDSRSRGRPAARIFACGTPMTNDDNTDWFKEGQNIAKAKELFQKAGYDGQPVVRAAGDRPLSRQSGRAVRRAMAAPGRHQRRSRRDGLGRAALAPRGEEAAGRGRLEHLLHHRRPASPSPTRSRSPARRRPARRPGSAGRPTRCRSSCATSGRPRRRSTSARRSPASCRRTAGTTCRTSSSASSSATPPGARTSRGVHRHARGGRRSGTWRSGGHRDLDARLHHPPARLDGARDGHRRGVRVPAAASLARRSGGDHRRRQRHAASRSPRSASQLGLDDAAAGAVLPLGRPRVLQGDLGISIFSNEPVAKLIGQRIEPTLSLALTTLIVAVTLAVTFGVLAAWKVGTLDRPRADGRLGARLLGAGVRRRLHADLRVLDQAALAAGAGLLADRPGLRAVARAADPALDRARPRLCGADRAHHPHRDARRAGRGLHPHRQRQGRRDALDAAQACAEERRRADRHRHRHRRRAADRRRRHHRDGVQHSRASAGSWSMPSPSATTRSSRA